MASCHRLRDILSLKATKSQGDPWQGEQSRDQQATGHDVELAHQRVEERIQRCSEVRQALNAEDHAHVGIITRKEATKTSVCLLTIREGPPVEYSV